MTKTQINQILIATVSTIAAGLALDYLRNKTTKTTQAPVVQDSSNWWSF